MDYCQICNIRVAPYDPQRFHLNGQLFHRSCVAAELAKPKYPPSKHQLILFKEEGHGEKVQEVPTAS